MSSLFGGTAKFYRQYRPGIPAEVAEALLCRFDDIIAIDNDRNARRHRAYGRAWGPGPSSARCARQRKDARRWPQSSAASYPSGSTSR
jgi:hypothetical protein